MNTRSTCAGAGLRRLLLLVRLIAMGSACLLSAFSILVSAQAEAKDSPVYPSLPECEKVLNHKDITWELYFDSHSDALTERGGKVAVELASIFLRDHGYIVALNGNIDGAESMKSDDRNLGARRAKAIARVFEQVGIRPDQIYTKDLGFSKPIVPQPPTNAESQNRRVVVIPMLAESDDLRERRLVCKAAIRTACLGSLKDEQRTLCEHALNILARN